MENSASADFRDHSTGLKLKPLFLDALLGRLDALEGKLRVACDALETIHDSPTENSHGLARIALDEITRMP